MGSILYYETDKEFISVKKSALSFMNNEWVIFVPNKEKHDEKEVSHKEEDNVQEFKPLDIKIIQENDEYVAVEGVEDNQEYVSDEPYKIKSIVLKSSLGGHGH
ncbi:MAG: hypothetical protein IPG15_05875 [Arcobacter sp.]|nr:hypothetical protein [Arcobacter sp.]